MSWPYYWRMGEGEELMGPTLTSCSDEKSAISQIMKIMGVNELPTDFQLIYPSYDTKFEADIHDAILMGIKLIRHEKAQQKPSDFLEKALSGFPHELRVASYKIVPKVGNSIYIKTCHHTVKFESNDVIYNLDDPQQLKSFTNELGKRIAGRAKRQETNKNVKSRISKIGSFKHNKDRLIQSAEFAIYLDDDNLTEANPYVVGNIKFYGKAPRNVLFEIDERKILTRDGKKEIEADNVDQVIDALIERLAGLPDKRR